MHRSSRLNLQQSPKAGNGFESRAQTVVTPNVSLYKIVIVTNTSAVSWGLSVIGFLRGSRWKLPWTLPQLSCKSTRLWKSGRKIPWKLRKLTWKWWKLPWELWKLPEKVQLPWKLEASVEVYWRKLSWKCHGSVKGSFHGIGGAVFTSIGFHQFCRLPQRL